MEDTDECNQCDDDGDKWEDGPLEEAKPGVGGSSLANGDAWAFFVAVGSQYLIIEMRCQPGIPCYGGSGCRMLLQWKGTASLPDALNQLERMPRFGLVRGGVRGDKLDGSLVDVDNEVSPRQQFYDL